MNPGHDRLLADLESYCAVLRRDVLDPESTLPAPPDIGGVTLAPGDLETATGLLEQIQATTAALTGLQTRVNGELAGLRRPSRRSRRRAPRRVDTAI